MFEVKKFLFTCFSDCVNSDQTALMVDGVWSTGIWGMKPYCLFVCLFGVLRSINNISWHWRTSRTCSAIPIILSAKGESRYYLHFLKTLVCRGRGLNPRPPSHEADVQTTRHRGDIVQQRRNDNRSPTATASISITIKEWTFNKNISHTLANRVWMHPRAFCMKDQASSCMTMQP